ncbi:MAG: GNAT family N-acetyltransferase [Deltaproteobacteria bacterium]
MNYEFIRYDGSYDEKIYDFQKQHWSIDSDLNKSYFRWKYFENPFSESPKIYLVLSEGKLIAFRGMYDTEWQIGGSSDNFKALCASDLVIHPEYRNKGIYQELMRFVLRDLNERGYRYLLNFSANTVNYIGSLAMGWKSIGKITVLEKNLNKRRSFPAKVAGSLLRKAGISEFISRRAKPGIRTIEDIHKNTKALPHHILLDKNPKPEEMASLVSKLEPRKKITLIRKPDYFRWRYRNPFSGFLFLYWQEKELKGYLVAQTRLHRESHDRKFNIVEIEAINSSIKIELIKCLASILDLGRLSIWANMLEQSSLKALKSDGFEEERPRRSVADHLSTLLVINTERENDKVEFRDLNLANMKNWDLKMIYSDNY